MWEWPKSANQIATWRTAEPAQDEKNLGPWMDHLSESSLAWAQQIISVKRQVVNALGFARHKVSVQLCHL